MDSFTRTRDKPLLVARQSEDVLDYCERDEAGGFPLRVSVGLEHADDLIADMAQALEGEAV